MTCFDLVLEISGETPDAKAGEVASVLYTSFVPYIEVFKGGHIIAAHHQTLPGIRRLHHIPGSVPSMAAINFHPALEKSN
jgi:hypothetical protein